MLMNWILAGMTAVAGYYAVNMQVNQAQASAPKEGDLAANMGVYRSAVTYFAQANPGFTGTVPDEQLAFPGWYARHPLWTNRIEDGTVAVYPVSAPSVNIAVDLVKLSRNSMLAGVARGASHTLYSPLFGDTGIVIPAAVPDGVPVWLARLK